MLHRLHNTNHCDLHADISKDNSSLLSPCYIEHIRFQTFVLLKLPLSRTCWVHMFVVSIVHNYLLLYDTHCTDCVVVSPGTGRSFHSSSIPISQMQSNSVLHSSNARITVQFCLLFQQCKNYSTILFSIPAMQELQYNSVFYFSNARITVQFCLVFQQCKNYSTILSPI